MTVTDVFTPRAVCGRCRRPETTCYCRHLTEIDTVTRVVLLQHPRERDVPIGTARMATLCLPNSELHVGVTWDAAALARVLGESRRDAVLLYPGAGATDVAKEPPDGPVTLVVVDGTWSQARKVVQRSPALAALRRYAFVPSAPSAYRIRREPDETCVSTIEALAHVLGALEGDPARFAALLEPFRAMVDMQLRYARHHGEKRTRHVRPPRRPPRPPAIFAEREASLVCVVGEANAWPHGSDRRPPGDPGELVHWVAHRVATGEAFEAVVAPRGDIADNTPLHVGLSAERLRLGAPLSTFRDAWRAFVRDDDVLCAWGTYARDLLAASGGFAPRDRLDVRWIARTLARQRVGALETFHATLGLSSTNALGAGRGGRRLSALVDVTRHFVDALRSAT